jgi:flavin-dependent dehydrogenase
LDCDVLIAGAGPAGCATAISLAQFAPDLRVVLADAAPPESLRIGEAVPPPIKPILEHLGLWQRFTADGHCSSYRTLSAWGSAQLASNEFLLHPHQVGWRLDRARFDAMLRQAALERVALHVPARVTGAARGADRWSIACGGCGSHTARMLVDATGRAAAVARLDGLRPVSEDRLVGCFVHFADAGGGHAEVLLETFPDGWWYSAVVPGGRRVVACMSDADLVGRLRLAALAHWMEALTQTRHVAGFLRQSRPLGPPRLRAAGSQLLSAATASALIAVGDAASCFDPISGQGILKALRSGIFASYAIADGLRHDPTGMRRYGSFVKSEFAAYRTTLRDYYALEQRWPANPFWHRRAAGKRSFVARSQAMETMQL